jgi:hypothetical protein
MVGIVAIAVLINAFMVVFNAYNHNIQGTLGWVGATIWSIGALVREAQE